VATIFSDKFNKLMVKAVPSLGRMEIKTSNNDVGETLTNIEGSVTGEDVEVNFNYKYISDCMQSINTTSIVFQFNGIGKLIIKGVGDSSFMYLVMPMNR
jgi:DNA polymerase-3 subunit beta